MAEDYKVKFAELLKAQQLVLDHVSSSQDQLRKHYENIEQDLQTETKELLNSLVDLESNRELLNKDILETKSALDASLNQAKQLGEQVVEIGAKIKQMEMD